MPEENEITPLSESNKQTDLLSLLTNKNVLIAAYFGIGLIVALYCWFFGVSSHKSFFFNLGKGLIWPAVIFPSFGKAVGSLLLVAFIAYMVFIK